MLKCYTFSVIFNQNLVAVFAVIYTCYCNRESVAHVRIIMTIVKRVSGIYTPLLQFTMTQQ